MAIKMVVTDIDGTILTYPEENLPAAEIKESVCALRDSGIQVAVATARNYNLSEEVLKYLGIEGTNIFIDGALIRSRDQIVSKLSLTPETVLLCQNFAEQAPVIPIYYTDSGNYMVIGEAQKKLLSSLKGAKGEELLFQVCGREKLEKLAVTESTQRVLFVSTSEEDSQKAYQLWEKWVHNITEEIEWSRTLGYIFGLCPKYADKGTALKKLAAQRGVELHEIMAFGDNENDIPMLKAAGIGVAVGNASEQVKAAADYVTGSVKEYGFCDAVSKLILK